MLPFPHRRDEGMAECLVYMYPVRGFCIVFLFPSSETGSLKNCTLFVHSKQTFYFLLFTDVRVRFLFRFVLLLGRNTFHIINQHSPIFVN